ncbi:glycosyltransferase 87 family protein [Niastella sp. OAS944]|uniref:glycosyltransferase 87 family protein n=1 Tax=Niastella sp. OAS944 TaxID=2664089 RepID=UPI0034955FDA|nr:hypothetical protein [Chitinophagaceae bacterium OAS944]
MISSNKGTLIAGILLLITLISVFCRDQILEQGGTNDLRNRVVGARLQKDGILPYFYRSNDIPMRYYGITHAVNGVSDITSSPFQHTLFYLFAEYPQRPISRIWFFVQYITLLITCLLAYRLSKTNGEKIAVSLAMMFFLCIEGWKVHIAQGQTYILIPFSAMMIYYCLSKRESLPAAFIAGLTAIVLVLIRPNVAIFFIPFLFIIKSYSRKYLTVFAIPIVLLSIIYFTPEKNRLFWKDYFSAIEASIEYHQGLASPKLVVTPKKNVLKSYEGWNVFEIKKIQNLAVYKQYSEHGNAFVIYKNLFHTNMPVPVLNLICGSSIILLVLLFYFTSKKHGMLELPNVAIFAFSLYMLSDLFSPVWRHQYYTVQWLFPLLVAASVYKPKNKWVYAFILLGLLLNITNTYLIKMEHTIGEYIFLLTFFYMSLTKSTSAGPASIS